MKRISGYSYQATIPAAELQEGCFKYNIIVCRGDSTRTYPAGNSVKGFSSGIKRKSVGLGLHCRFILDYPYCRSRQSNTVLSVTDTHSGIEAYTLPEWNDLKRTLIDFSPIEKPLLRFAFTSKGEKTHHFLRKSIQDVLKERKRKIKELHHSLHPCQPP